MDFAPRLQTDRLRLGPLAARDFGFFCRLLRNREVRRFLGGPVPWTELYPRFRQSLTGSPDVGIWTVRAGDGGRPMGLVELGPHKDGRDHEVSYQFLPRYRGRGLAGEAVGAVIEHGLSGGRLPRIIAETQAANGPSRRLLERLGMVELGRVERFGAEQIIFGTG